MLTNHTSFFKCSKCEANSFELAKLPLIGDDGYMPYVINCSKCGTVVGVVPADEVIKNMKDHQIRTR